MEENFPKTNPIFMMVNSGARGNMMQMRQIAGMRGLVANPKGETIPRPIKANFREGLSVLEYFISTHGARKGLADTALRTADSGYLTRRLVDVSQDVIIREEDCGTERGLRCRSREPNADGVLVRRTTSRPACTPATLAEDVVASRQDRRRGRRRPRRRPHRPLIAARHRRGQGPLASSPASRKVGTCAICYGRSLATGKLVDVGEAVGIIAAQSIGEPGTQLTMRTFHTGGVAGEDITHGLPRVVELFEARTPKGVAPISEVGRPGADRGDREDARRSSSSPTTAARRRPTRLQAVPAAGRRRRPRRGRPAAHRGAINPHEVLRILGPREVQLHLVGEVQEVYRSQGVSIHDKHIEVIIRQMLQPGDDHRVRSTPSCCPASSSSARCSRRRTVGSWPRAAPRPPAVRELMGITKASLATESWLSAASFQETTRVLTDAAIHAKSRPAARPQGERHHRQAHPGRYRPAPLPQHPGRADRGGQGRDVLHGRVRRRRDAFDYAPFGTGSGQAVPLEDFDYGPFGTSESQEARPGRAQEPVTLAGVAGVRHDGRVERTD